MKGEGKFCLAVRKGERMGSGRRRGVFSNEFMYYDLSRISNMIIVDQIQIKTSDQISQYQSRSWSLPLTYNNSLSF